MIRADQANEELTMELQRSRKRITELEAFHNERQPGGDFLQQIEAQAILESYSEGLLVLDRKGRLIDTNKKLEEISGYQKKELVGKTTLSLARLLTNKGLSVYWRNPLNKTFDTSGAPHEIDIFKKNGGLVTVQTVCQELRENNKVVGHLVILEDVTERRRTERESHESLEVYKSLVSHVEIGIFRVTAGPAGRFLQVNHAVEEITGYSRQELLQMNVEDLYVHPEERTKHIKEVLSGMPAKAREVRFKKKDGTEIIVRDKKIAARSNDGKALYLEGFLEDITERKGVERALQSSEQNLHNTLDSSPMGIYIIDADLNTLYANQALLDMFGYENIEEIRTKPLDQHYTPESRVGLVQRRERYLRGEPNPDKFELDIVRVDGTIRHLQAYRKEILWDGKKQRQVIYHDITELRKAEEALKESEQYLRNFLDKSVMGVRFRQDGYIVYANQALLDIFGCENIDELRASPPEERYTPECYAGFLQRKKKSANGEPIPTEIDVNIVRKDGTIRHLQVFGRQVLLNGKIQTQTFYNDTTEHKAEELKILESERQYRLLAENMTDMIWKVNVDSPGQLNYISPSVTHLLGYPVEEAMNKNMAEIFTPRSYSDAMKALAEERSHINEEPIDQSNSRTMELELKHKDGSIVFVEVNFALIRGVDGRPNEILAVARDITERRHAEERLRQSQTKYSTLVEKGNDGVVIIQDGLISFANSKMTNITGTPPAESIGRSFVDFVVPKYRTFVADNYLKRIMGESAAGRYEIEILSQDGTCIPVEICANAIEYEGRHADMAVIRDITERKRAEEALKASEEKYSTLVEQSSDGIIILNGSLIEFGNRMIYEVSGYRQGEIIGKNFSELISKESNELLRERKRIRQTGNPVPDNYELEILTKHGQKITVETKIQPIVYKGISARMVIIRDITENKEAEKLVRESEHNLRTYLENAPDGVYLNDLNGHFLYGNKKAEEILGYNKEELIGSNFLKLNLLPAKYLVKAGKLLALNAMGKNTGPDEFELIKKDNSRIWVEINTAPIKQKDKKVVVGFVRDITDRKKSEELLYQEKNRAQIYLDIAAVMIIALDNEGKVTLINRRGCEILGYKADEIIGKNWFTNFLPERMRAEVLNVWRRINAGEIESLQQYENQVLTSDGQERTIAWSNVELRNATGKIIGTLSSGEDITTHQQAEKALRESEEKYRLIVENSTDIIFTLNTQGEFVYLSPSVKKVLGYNQSDLLGRSFRSLVHPDDVRVIDKAEQSHNVDGVQPTVNDEYRFRDASGEWRWFVSTGVPMREKHGDVFSFVGVARDITAQKKTEAELKASEQNFRNSMDSSVMGIRITGDNEYILYANQALLDTFGYENIEELRASPPQEHYTPESYVGFIQRKEEYARGESIPDELEIDIIRNDGAVRHLQLSSMKVLWNGKEQRQTMYNDVTEHRQAENRLEEAAREWRTTFDSITDLISIHDKDNRIIRVNRALADLLHTTPQELIGKSCPEVMRGDQECPVNCPHLLALKTGKSSAIEIFNSKLGVHLQESASPIINKKGEISGTVLVARDVTQQKRMEEQLVMTDRLASIGELSSGIAHELNNPLTSVIGFSQLLMEGDVPANMKEDLGIVYSEAQRAAAIVKNLLTFARKHAPVKELTNVNSVIEDVLRLRAYEQKVNNIEVKNRLTPNLPEIMIDHFQMQQVFLNIMVNAEFAMQEAHQKGKLVITTEKSRDVIRVSFADDGPGISKENLKHIFDPFFTTKEVGKGTGLGLSICHGIVSEHGGQIYARSEKGQGTTFVVELPLINGQ